MARQVEVTLFLNCTNNLHIYINSRQIHKQYHVAFPLVLCMSPFPINFQFLSLNSTLAFVMLSATVNEELSVRC
jgi:hypothetical protein